MCPSFLLVSRGSNTICLMDATTSETDPSTLKLYMEAGLEKCSLNLPTP